MKIVLCVHDNCTRFGSADCGKCKNNHARNKAVDAFVLCEDADFSKVRSSNGRYKTKQIGTAEQGGLKCPACGYLNNCYTFNENDNYECASCGLPLTLR